jgi:GTP-binding protein Era
MSLNNAFKSGYVAVMGRPNVGKSTLINSLLGQKVAAVSPRPQTTRKRQLGILTGENYQIVFVDTPGVHSPRHKLGEKMNQFALEILRESDLVLFLADASQEPDQEDRLLADNLKKLSRNTPVILVLNKIDLVSPDLLDDQITAYQKLVEAAHLQLVSAAQGTHLDELLALILTLLPEGTLIFPEDQVTDYFEREIAADLIREACLIELRDEVPHGIAVRMDQYIERDTGGAYIEATVIVEREAHKGIVIGQEGRMIKRIGERARLEIEAMTGRKVYVKLRVKVRKNWRDDEKILGWFGY